MVSFPPKHNCSTLSCGSAYPSTKFGLKLSKRSSGQKPNRVLAIQAQHQALDDGFVGLIISCFNKDQKLHCTAFQSEPAEIESAPLSVDHEDPDMREALKLSLEG